MYFDKVKTILLTGKDTTERFPTVFRSDGVPGYYPTCLMLQYRLKGYSRNTLERHSQNLIHMGVWASRENLSINKRLENGDYFHSHELETLVEACSYSTTFLRKLASLKVSSLRSKKSRLQDNLVSNDLKAARLTVVADYFQLVARMSERHLSRSSVEYRKRIVLRKEMINELLFHRPKVRDSRVGEISYKELALVTEFLSSKSPYTILNDHEALWEREPLIERNWAILRCLLECGLRNSELRQLKLEDIDLTNGVLTVYRRPDDKDDPRLREPNAKTYDRHIPIGDDLCIFLENYILSSGSDAAEKSGSPFLFLSHSRSNFGDPISGKTVRRVVAKLGEYLGIEGLTPHNLRHTWMQNLANWSIKNGIEPGEFERFANTLGGWSYLSKMATKYRGDQLTEAAFKAGMKIERQRR